MNIFIKTFNRPYSLERCIRSIKENVMNYSDIIILDDGTEKKYIDKILQKHPDLKIVYSETADYKYEYIINNLEKWFYYREKKYDPANFWITNIAKYADECFLLLEDDFWVVEKIDLRVFQQHILTNNIIFTKLNQVNNAVFAPNEEVDIKVYIEKNPALFYCLPRINSLNDVWKIYLVAGAIYKKEYYLHTYEGIPFFSEENYLLQRAVQYVNQVNGNPYRVRFAKTEMDAVKQGWSSTAIGRPEEIAQGFNAYLCNKALNECWYADELDAMYNFPNDFPEDYIITMFHKMSLEIKQIECWRGWRRKWFQAYKDIGIELNK